MDDKALLHSVHLRQKDFVTERADDTTKTAKNPSSKNEFPARKQGLKARSCVAYWKQSGCHLPHNAFTAVCSSVSGISQKWQITRSKNNNSLILAFMGTMGKWTLNWTINYYVPDIFSSMYLLLSFLRFVTIWQYLGYWPSNPAFSCVTPTESVSRNTIIIVYLCEKRHEMKLGNLDLHPPWEVQTKEFASHFMNLGF